MKLIRAVGGRVDSQLRRHRAHHRSEAQGPDPAHEPFQCAARGERLPVADSRASKITFILARSEPRDLVDLLFLDRGGYLPGPALVADHYAAVQTGCSIRCQPWRSRRTTSRDPRVVSFLPMDAELDHYVLAHREREARARALRHAEAWRVARAAAELLRREVGVRRVLVFGSLARGTMNEGSDIDLAVEGLEPRCYFDVLARLQDLGRFELQLAPLESCLPHIRDAALREGVEL